MRTIRRMNEDRIASAVWHLDIDVEIDDRLLSIRGCGGRTGEAGGECSEIAP